MGIRNSSKFIWKALGVHPREIQTILKKLHAGFDGPFIVDVDTLLLYHQALANLGEDGAAASVVKKMKVFAEYGFEVNGILDGDMRPDCKRAAWDRIKESELAAINAVSNRQVALSLTASLSEGNHTAEEHDKIVKEIKLLNNQSRIVENRVRPTVPENLQSQIEDIIFRTCVNSGTFMEGKVNENLIKAKFQADSMMAERQITGKSHVLVTIDSDMMVWLGPDCFVIRSVGNSQKRKKGVDFASCEVGGCGADLYNLVQLILKRPAIQWTPIINPILDHPSAKLRSYIAIALGCDVWKGVPNVGPAAISKFFQKDVPKGLETEQVEMLFLDFLVRKTNDSYRKHGHPHKFDADDDTPGVFDRAVVECLSQSFLCEAVAEQGHGEVPFKYALGKPDTLTAYNEYFKHDGDDEISIVPGPPTVLCGGIDGVSEQHMYLEVEGTSFCAACKVPFCRTCGYIPGNLTPAMKAKTFYKNKNVPLCLICYKTSSTTQNEDEPDRNGFATDDNDGDEGGRERLKEMKKKLAEINIHVPDYALAHEVEDMYDHYIHCKPLYEATVNMNEFPQYDSAFFHDVKRDIFYKGQIMSPSGFLFANPKITMELVAKIIELYASLVTYQSVGTTPLSTSAPGIIINFANNSRQTNQTAQKLVRSAIRHATDERIPPITYKDLSLFRHHTDERGDEVGMILENSVPASMRHLMYCTKTAFTATSLIACSCTCLSSGKDTEEKVTGTKEQSTVKEVNGGKILDVKGNVINHTRVTCAHNLPLPYQVTLELHRGLAIDFLHDLSALWTQDYEAYHLENVDTYDRTRNHILTLMQASTVTDNAFIERTRNTSVSIMNLLKEYSVTTEKSKRVDYTPPTRFEIIPLRYLPVESVFTRNKRLKENSGDNNGSTTRDAAPQASVNDTDTNGGGGDNNRSTTRDAAPQESVNDTDTNGGARRRTVNTNDVISTRTGASNVLHSEEPSFSSDSSYSSDSSEELDSPFGLSNTDDEILLQAHQLTPEENIQIVEATQRELPTNVFLSSFDALRRSTRGTTQSRNLWMNDEIINRIGALLMEEDRVNNPDRPSYFLNSQFMFWLTETVRGYDFDGVRTWSNSFPHQNIFEKLKYLIVPVNINNTHWAILIVDFAQRVIRYLDSLGASGSKYMDAMLDYFGDYAREKNLPFDQNDWYCFNLQSQSPQQENTYDCGVIVMINAYLYIHDLPLLYTQSDIDKCKSRLIFALSILQGKALPPITIRVRRTKKNLQSDPVANEVDSPRDSTVLSGTGTNIIREDILNTQVNSMEDFQRADSDDSVYEYDSEDDNAEDDSISEGHNEKEPKELLNHVPELLELKKQVEEGSKSKYELPVYETYDVDYTRIFLMLVLLFGKASIPIHFIGYALIVKRMQKEKISSTLSKKQFDKYVKQKRGVLSLDWRKIVKKLEEHEHLTSNLKVNTNGRARSSSKSSSNKKKEAHKSKRRYGKNTHRHCSFHNCKFTSGNSTCTFECIPTMPPKRDVKELLTKRLRDIKRYYRRVLQHKLACDRCLIKPGQKGDFRICSNHEKEFVSVRHVVERPGKKPVALKFTFVVPKADVKRKTNDSHDVMARDRLVVQSLKNVPDDSLKELTMFAMTACDTIEVLKSKGEKDMQRLGQKVMDLLDIDDEGIADKLKFSSAAKIIDGKAGRKTIRSLNMDNDEIKMRTGFSNKKELLGYIAIVCNGSLLEMIKTKSSSLSWWEEWFLYEEFLWGRSWVNQTGLVKEYHLNSARKNDIIDAKLMIVLSCRASWPMYCTHDEDVSLRTDKWDGIIGTNERVIEHDATGFALQFKPSLAGSQKITFSRYFNGNSAKVDNAIQLCGWMRGSHMFVGAVSDSQYMLDNKIFEHQEEFQNADRVNDNDEVIPFTNILDRGYQLSLQAFRHGKQTVWQPDFQKKRRRFTGSETLRSASCASVRSGNERAMRKGKLSGFLRKGLRPGENPRRYDDVWLAWTFQCNFMYRPNA